MRPLLLLALVGCASKPAPVGDTDPPDDTELVDGTCVDPDLAANPYACVGPVPPDDCTQAPTLQGWADAACTWQTANPTGCLPPRLPCTLDDGRTGTVIAAQADDVMSWPVYDDAGVHVGTFVRSDSGNEFCGRTADAWFGDPDWLTCVAIVPYYDPPDGCEPDACGSAP